MLAHTDSVGALIGKGGSRMKEISDETGCKLKVSIKNVVLGDIMIINSSLSFVSVLLLLSSEDNLMINCLPGCLSMFMFWSSTGSCSRSTWDPLVV